MLSDVPPGTLSLLDGAGVLAESSNVRVLKDLDMALERCEEALVVADFGPDLGGIARRRGGGKRWILAARDRALPPADHARHR